MLSAMDKRTQQEYISWRADELARSGDFRSWVEIVRQLRAEGAYIAHTELSAPYTRWRLSRLCAEARRMSHAVTSIAHRHGDQKSTDPDLVIEIGRPLPSIYQAGKPLGVTAVGIALGDPTRCTLSDGDVILIGRSMISRVT